ncbi:MAG: hypothetical protein E6H04_08990 [Bacillati bacterium ANGP1]|uniref:Ketopantoate reductase C-terminal domain-containing protein n=1 Tax=Candidatus Segetimicrobium genomatis TaxID=2569760 RepID=A0A537JAX4_9BACT|nr:MAG: hypothetical protein E6H04_08990 [Terrabacteria group bacterium ANGP1]
MREDLRHRASGGADPASRRAGHGGPVRPERRRQRRANRPGRRAGHGHLRGRPGQRARRSPGGHRANRGTREADLRRQRGEPRRADRADLPALPVLWEKFVFICGFSGTTALTRLTIGPVLGCQETKAFLRETMTEVETVARSQGVALARGLADRYVTFAGGLEPWALGSMAHDLHSGKRLELESLNGTVVRLGRAAGVPAPLNFAIYAALKPFVDGPPAAPRPGG